MELEAKYAGSCEKAHHIRASKNAGGLMGSDSNPIFGRNEDTYTRIAKRPRNGVVGCSHGEVSERPEIMVTSARGLHQRCASRPCVGSIGHGASSPVHSYMHKVNDEKTVGTTKQREGKYIHHNLGKATSSYVESLL